MSSLALTFLLVSQTLSLPPGLLQSICFIETSHRPAAVNPHDGGSASIGICQVKLDTARQLGYTGDAEALLDPSINVLYAGKYLKYQLKRYDSNPVLAVSAYNAGSAKISKNRRYVNKVFTIWGGDNAY